MMRVQNISVKCIPPKTTSQQKGAFNCGGKIRFFTKAKVKQTQADYMTLLMPHVPETPFQGPLKFYVALTWPWRKGEPKKNRVRGIKYHTTKPDFDNITKTLCDIMTKLRFWEDDAQIAVGCVAKFWGDEPGIKITIAELFTNKQETN